MESIEFNKDGDIVLGEDTQLNIDPEQAQAVNPEFAEITPEEPRRDTRGNRRGC